MLSKPFFIAHNLLLALLFFTNTHLYSVEESLQPTFCIGGGYLDAGIHHSGGVFQMEYRAGTYLWKYLRPQVTFLLPEFSAFFLGLGLGWECTLTKRIILTPSFVPGFYYRGNSRNLGFPVEFRSAIELAYRFDKGTVGVQISHLSNAHLGYKNPGINAFILFLGFPIGDRVYTYSSKGVTSP